MSQLIWDHEAPPDVVRLMLFSQFVHCVAESRLSHPDQIAQIILREINDQLALRDKQHSVRPVSDEQD